MDDRDRVEDDFVAMTSHELRAPLTVIRGFTRTLLRGDIELDAVERHRLVEVVDRQSARLARLVDDLLTASRMDAGMFDLVTAEHDPAELLRRWAEEWVAEPARVELRLGGDLPVIRTDADRLAQVVRNLVDNAVRYGAGSQVLVAARRDGDDLVVEVRDQGPGIPPADLPHVFERFRQAGTPADHRAGMGLGLYITHRLVTALGGTIAVESRVGKGTSFAVRLPAAPTPPAARRRRPRSRRPAALR